MPRYGPLMILLGVVQGLFAFAYASTLAPVGLVLLAWSGLSFVRVGAAYLIPGIGAGVFGKRRDGSIAVARALALLPYLALSHMVWQVRTLLTREAACSQVLPYLYLGRRPRALRELPPDTMLVADLTAEFAAAPDIRCSPAITYRCLPTLDTATPNPAAVEQLAAEIAAAVRSQRTVYVHCALGHGRSAFIAAEIVHYLGEAHSAEEAIRRVRAARPGIALSQSQRCLLAELCRCSGEPSV